jgi:hypothetical protein
MSVYVVSVVCDDEYGCTAVDEIFATVEGAQAYLAELVEAEDADGEEVMVPRSEARHYPWYADEEGELLYSVREWAVR